MIKKWPKIDNNLIKNWPKIDQKMTKNRRKFDQKWPKNRLKYESKNDQKSTKNWPKIVICCTPTILIDPWFLKILGGFSGVRCWSILANSRRIKRYISLRARVCVQKYLLFTRYVTILNDPRGLLTISPADDWWRHLAVHIPLEIPQCSCLASIAGDP